jgi:hypothetical protein
MNTTIDDIEDTATAQESDNFLLDEKSGEYPTRCQVCDSTDIECDDSVGFSYGGFFQEFWQCNNCDATGRVEGDAAHDPDTFTQNGELFTGETPKPVITFTEKCGVELWHYE